MLLKKVQRRAKRASSLSRGACVEVDANSTLTASWYANSFIDAGTMNAGGLVPLELL
jgi:hypothetical protein